MKHFLIFHGSKFWAQFCHFYSNWFSSRNCFAKSSRTRKPEPPGEIIWLQIWPPDECNVLFFVARRANDISATIAWLTFSKPTSENFRNCLRQSRRKKVHLHDIFNVCTPGFCLKNSKFSQKEENFHTERKAKTIVLQGESFFHDSWVNCQVFSWSQRDDCATKKTKQKVGMCHISTFFFSAPLRPGNFRSVGAAKEISTVNP